MFNIGNNSGKTLRLLGTTKPCLGRTLAVILVAGIVSLGYILHQTPSATAQGGPNATRSLSSVTVASSGTLTVTIGATNYGQAGGVTETLPKGFSYVESTLDDAQVEELARNQVRFILQGDTSFTYTVTASNKEDSYTFSGTLRDSDRNDHEVGGEATVTVSSEDPLLARYDTNNNGAIDKSEVTQAINDYLFGEGFSITKAEMIQVINLYLFGTTPVTTAKSPGEPTGLTATARGPTGIDLSWSAPSSDGGVAVTGYRIEVSTDGSAWSDLVADTNSSGTTYSHTGLTLGDTRFYRVSAINPAGTGPASNVATATTAPTPSGNVSAARSFSTASVAPGGRVVVTITAASYGQAGGVTETLPKGFSYVESTLDDAQIEELARNQVRFILQGDTSLTYTVTASNKEDSYTFSGTLRDSDRKDHVIGGEATVTVSSEDPLLARYDTNNNGAIDKSEVTRAINDYLFGEGFPITKAEMIQVINLYLFGTTPVSTVQTPAPTPTPWPTPASPAPTWVFTEDVPQPLREALQVELEQARWFFSDQFGVEASGFTVLMGVWGDEFKDTYMDVVGTEVPSWWGPGSAGHVTHRPSIPISAENTIVVLYADTAESLGAPWGLETIVHEYVHVVQQHLTSDHSSVSGPKWTLEGWAEYGVYLYRGFLGPPSGIGVARLYSICRGVDDPALTLDTQPYTMGALAAAFLAEHLAVDDGVASKYLALNGMEKYYYVVSQTGNSREVAFDWERAFKDAYGISVPDFYEAFNEWSKSEEFAELADKLFGRFEPDGRCRIVR